MPPEVDLFAFEGVRLVVDGATVLDGVDARLPDDGLTAIVGPSGSGKSTLLRLCNRLEVPTEGTVRFRGDDLAALDPLALRRRVGMVFQRPTLFPGTVADNLAVAEPAIGEDAAADALHRAGLDRSFLTRTADDLSGGEAQRACLARTLVTEPEVLLMDEPTSALDADSTHVLERLGRDLADAGIPVLWVTHDLHQVDRIADRRLRVEQGRVVEGGDPT
ncbi:MAG: phosphate ABC transporter ATP-binding protein [Acidimicrobiales bacterium]|nr:phosphate ABC transporter ATP-binding protein [Acidimicrobiales bacterium]